MKKFISGFITGAVIFTCTTAFAAVAIRVTENKYPILHWNSPANIEAYNINDYTYLKLADVGSIFGVPVAFEDDTIHNGDLKKTNIAYYMPDYTSVPNLEPCIEYPPSSIVIEGDRSRVTYDYGLVHTKYGDSLAKFEEILRNDGFQKVANINAKLDFLSKPTGNDVVYNKSTIYVSIEDGGLDESSFQRVIIRMAHGDMIGLAMEEARGIFEELLPQGELLEKLGYEVFWNENDGSIRLYPRPFSEYLSIDAVFGEPLNLIGADYDEDIFLYSLNPDQNGAILTHKNISKYFDWSCYSPRLILPHMKVLDYDNDGQKEVAVSLNNGSGTYIDIDELHIVKIGDNDLIDYKYDRYACKDDLDGFLQNNIYSKDENLYIHIQSDNNAVDIDLSTIYPDVKNADDLVFIIYTGVTLFWLEDNGAIQMNMDLCVGRTPESAAGPNRVAIATAEVVFRDGIFSLSNVKIEAANPEIAVTSDIIPINHNDRPR